VRSILVIVSVLIAYGSLYPFDFQLPRDMVGALGATAILDPYATSRGDILGNVALFLPFGFAGMLATARLGGAGTRLLVVLASGALLAAFLQGGQLFLPERDPALVDVLWNAVGVTAGAVVGFTPLARRLLSADGSAVRIDVPLVLAGLWVARQLVPLVPSLDLRVVKSYSISCRPRGSRESTASCCRCSRSRCWQPSRSSSAMS
jgi:VanZ family protein